MVGSDVYSRLFHFICAICLIVACFWNPHALIVLLCIVNVILLWIPCQGDVRYVGKAHRWAHTDLGEGIVRALQQHGENVIFGNRNTKILVIGEGYSASLAGEKIVILEPFVLAGSANEGHFEEFNEIRTYAKVIKKVANELGCYFVPLQEKFDKAEAKYGGKIYLFDGVHPNIAGATLIANEWLKVFSNEIDK